MSEANQGYVKIALTKGKFCLIDEIDIPTIGKYRWCYSRGRAVRKTLPADGLSLASISMHRQIMGFPDDFEVDHIDGNPLNNRRSNLRLATRTENQRNVGPRKDSYTQSKGVFFTPRVKRGKSWHAEIRVGRKSIHLGVYHTKEEADAAYEAKAREIHGEFFRKEPAKEIDWESIPEYKRSERMNVTASGFRGVYAYLRKWKAVFRHEKKNIYLGLFPTPELASAAVEAKIKELRS